MLPHDEERISIEAMCRHPLLQRDGLPLSLAAGYRKICHGSRSRRGFRVKIETETGPRRLVTTKEAIVRYIER